MDFSDMPMEIYADYLEEQGMDVSKLRGFITMGMTPVVSARGTGKAYSFRHAPDVCKGDGCLGPADNVYGRGYLYIPTRVQDINPYETMDDILGDYAMQELESDE